MKSASLRNLVLLIRAKVWELVFKGFLRGGGRDDRSKRKRGDEGKRPAGTLHAD